MPVFFQCLACRMMHNREEFPGRRTVRVYGGMTKKIHLPRAFRASTTEPRIYNTLANIRDAAGLEFRG